MLCFGRWAYVYLKSHWRCLPYLPIICFCICSPSLNNGSCKFTCSCLSASYPLPMIAYSFFSPRPVVTLLTVITFLVSSLSTRSFMVSVRIITTMSTVQTTTLVSIVRYVFSRSTCSIAMASTVRIRTKLAVGVVRISWGIARTSRVR